MTINLSLRNGLARLINFLKLQQIVFPKKYFYVPQHNCSVRAMHLRQHGTASTAAVAASLVLFVSMSVIPLCTNISSGK